MEQQHAIRYLALSQEELIDAGAFDLQMSIAALEKGLLDFEKGKILFPDKIVQIFDQETQDRINCLPATLLEEGAGGGVDGQLAGCDDQAAGLDALRIRADGCGCVLC